MKLAVLAASVAVAPALTLPAPVTTIAADGSRIAVATGKAGGDCDRIRVWNAATGRVTRLARTTHCEDTSTGRGIAAVSIAGTRVLWLHFVGGNTREWSLFTASTTAPRPKRLRFVAQDVDLPAPIVLGEGDGGSGGVLPYAVGRDVFVLRANGSRRFSWRATARVVALDTEPGEVAVASSGGDVAILGLDGRVVRTERFGSEFDAVQLTGGAVLVQRARTLELRGNFAPRTFHLAAGARLRDAAAGGAFYVVRGSVHRLDLGTGADRALAVGSDVQAEGARIAVANGRRVSIVAVPSR